jgi:hypothetical protein
MTQQKFTLEIHQPYSTFTDGKPTAIPYVIDGLLPKAAFSVIGAKPKHGKSSFARIEAVCVSKGQPFLDREATQGEVLLCSLEDSPQHVDNHLHLLGYDPQHDARIHIVSRLSHDVTETIDAIADGLAKHPHINLVVLDTLAKVLRAKDSNDYDEMLRLCEQLRALARKTGVHVQAISHCKKVQPEDPFDGFLGSVAVRGETDTNICLYRSRGKQLLQSETRMGTPWDATEIHAELATVGKSQMLKRFALGSTLADANQEADAIQEQCARRILKRRIVDSLREHNGEAKMSDCLDSIPGRKQLKYEMRDELIKDGVIKISGVSHSPSNPLRLTLLKPDWVDLVITNPSAPEAALERPVPPALLPEEFFVCRYRDCTNQVLKAGQVCGRHYEFVTEETSCAN